jgi:hypothetical protein
MTRKRAAALALTTTLALAGPPLEAQGSHRGGGPRPGGGRPGGAPPGVSHAVPRGAAPARPGVAPGHGTAAYRHPRAGTGRAYYPGYGGSYYRPYYGGRYSGYHGYRYPYYRPYPYASVYVGWPYASFAWGPYGYASPSYTVSYHGSSEPAPAASEAEPAAPSRDTGRLRLEVRPEDASVYVDDEFRGNARETKYLVLRSGRHSIELVRPGFEVARYEVDVARGETRDLFVELRRP